MMPVDVFMNLNGKNFFRGDNRIENKRHFVRGEKTKDRSHLSNRPLSEWTLFTEAIPPTRKTR